MPPITQFCTFYLDKMLFGVELTGVQEVIRTQDTTRVPLAPRVVDGLINLRGQIVTVVDLRSRLELSPKSATDVTMYVIVSTADGAVSLQVDEIGDVVDADASAFEPPPGTLHGPIRNVIVGVYKLHDKLLHALDIERAWQMATGEATA